MQRSVIWADLIEWKARHVHVVCRGCEATRTACVWRGMGGGHFLGLKKQRSMVEQITSKQTKSNTSLACIQNELT